MRESIGGAFLIKIMVVFIVIYNTLLAIAVNYAIAFRVKNQIINIIEQNEGCRNTGDQIKNYVSSIGYYKAETVAGKGYTVEATQVAGRGTFYTVKTYIEFDLPVIDALIRPAITGETKVIYGVSETTDACSGL